MFRANKEGLEGKLGNYIVSKNKLLQKGLWRLEPPPLLPHSKTLTTAPN
ncbi:hypothetical protein KSS87_012368, partial [Heliosperma pusillum]